MKIYVQNVQQVKIFFCIIKNIRFYFLLLLGYYVNTVVGKTYNINY